MGNLKRSEKKNKPTKKNKETKSGEKALTRRVMRLGRFQFRPGAHKVATRITRRRRPRPHPPSPSSNPFQTQENPVKPSKTQYNSVKLGKT